MYGGMWTIPVPDIDRTQYLLMLGANPAGVAGQPPGRARTCSADSTRFGPAADAWSSSTRGAPRRPTTPTSGSRSARAPTRRCCWPSSTSCSRDGWVNLRHLAPQVDGLDAVRTLCAPFSPDAVADVCAIEATTIRRLARELAQAEPGAVYGRIGTCTQEFGTLASWLVEVINILTGNLDRPGGSMFANPAAFSLISLRPPDQAGGFQIGRWHSRVRHAPEVLGQYPLGCLAEEITTPGDGQIRALITVAGNPVLSAPDGARLDAALAQLECMISVDNYLNETTRHADVILPGLSVLEQPHYDEMIWGWAVRNAAKYSAPVFHARRRTPGRMGDPARRSLQS